MLIDCRGRSQNPLWGRGPIPPRFKCGPQSRYTPTLDPMSTSKHDPSTADPRSTTGAPGEGEAARELSSPLTPPEIVQRLDQGARRGLLPGFAKGSGVVLFTMADFGMPFESKLEARAKVTPAGTVSSAPVASTKPDFTGTARAAPTPAVREPCHR